MKLYHITLLSILLGSFVIATAEAALEVHGTVTPAGKTTFKLSDPATGFASGWLMVGQSFQGYTLVAFDGVQKVVVVRKSGATLKLPLRSTPGGGDEIAQAVLSNLRRLSLAADQYYMEKGVERAVGKDVIREMNVTGIRKVDGEDYDSMVLLYNQPLKITTKSGVEVTYQAAQMP